MCIETAAKVLWRGQAAKSPEAKLQCDGPHVLAE